MFIHTTDVSIIWHLDNMTWQYKTPPKYQQDCKEELHDPDAVMPPTGHQEEHQLRDK